MRLLTTRDGLPRLSWGSIIAGVILSMIVYLIMSVLGTAIGASLLSPMSKPDPSMVSASGRGSGSSLLRYWPSSSARTTQAAALLCSDGSMVCFLGR